MLQVPKKLLIKKTWWVPLGLGCYCRFTAWELMDGINFLGEHLHGTHYTVVLYPLPLLKEDTIPFVRGNVFRISLTLVSVGQPVVHTVSMIQREKMFWLKARELSIEGKNFPISFLSKLKDYPSFLLQELLWTFTFPSWTKSNSLHT